MSKAIRHIRVEGNIAYVPLTKGYEAVIDAADVPLVNRWNWFAIVQPHSTYALSNAANKKMQLLHRLILGAPVGVQVDHINGNGLDNCRANLRLASPSQNQHNKGIQRNNSSGAKGVRWKQDKNKWVARIDLHGKRKHLGYFNCITAAAMAYAKASRDMHGAFGRTA